ncbi:hypothetical protein VT84_00625 [Gemmata sp. SH-PL17]|nr:hypothetical protein VT84_00625 [Gemmata sp. SH-PL17]
MNRRVTRMSELSVPIRQRGAVVKIVVRIAGAPNEFGPFPAYLDTGASVTVLDPGVIHALGAEPIAEAGLHVLGRDTVSHHGVFAVEVALADAGEKRWFALEALDGPINPKGTAGALGRDFLEHFVFTYDGPGNRVRLRW